jgi:hypothetical protein
MRKLGTVFGLVTVLAGNALTASGPQVRTIVMEEDQCQTITNAPPQVPQSRIATFNQGKNDKKYNLIMSQKPSGPAYIKIPARYDVLRSGTYINPLRAREALKKYCLDGVIPTNKELISWGAIDIGPLEVKR